MGEEIAPKCEKCSKRLWNHSNDPDREICVCAIWPDFKYTPVPPPKPTFNERLQEKALERGYRLYTEADLRKAFKKGWLKAHNKEDLHSDKCWQQYKQQLEKNETQ